MTRLSSYDEALNYQHGASDLHLNGGAGGLALTNTGHPLILDVDGSRSDVGAYGGPRPLVDNGDAGLSVRHVVDRCRV
jgi:hypothetical protein